MSQFLLQLIYLSFVYYMLCLSKLIKQRCLLKHFINGIFHNFINIALVLITVSLGICRV